MFERLVADLTASRGERDVFIFSFAFTLVAVLLIHHVLRFKVGGSNLGGLVSAAFLSIALAYPFVRYLLDTEEAELSGRASELQLLRHHADELLTYLTFFLGATFGFATARFLVPGEFFTTQCTVLTSLGRPITESCRVVLEAGSGATTASATGFAAGAAGFGPVIQNNLFVFGATFIATFLFTSGLVFILAWNASVLGVWIGSVAATAAESVAFIPFAAVAYLPHGVLEIGGYVAAGVGGALLSRYLEGLIFRDAQLEQRHIAVLTDVAVIVVIGLIALFAGAAVEVL